MKKLIFLLTIICTLVNSQYQNAFAKRDGIEVLLDAAYSVNFDKKALGTFGIKEVESEGFEAKQCDLWAFELQLSALYIALNTLNEEELKKDPDPSSKDTTYSTTVKIKTVFDKILIAATYTTSGLKYDKENRRLTIYIDEDWIGTDCPYVGFDVIFEEDVKKFLKEKKLITTN